VTHHVSQSIRHVPFLLEKYVFPEEVVVKPRSSVHPSNEIALVGFAIRVFGKGQVLLGWIQR
jgi:hypothetical protein